MVYRLSAPTLDNDWWAYARWRDRFAEVLDTRFYTRDWLDNEVWEGRARCWSNPEGAIVAEIRRYPTGAVEVHGLVAAGELSAIRSLIPRAEAWGRQFDAVCASVSSRAGWIRALRDDGYAIWQTELRKELNVGHQR